MATNFRVAWKSKIDEFMKGKQLDRKKFWWKIKKLIETEAKTFWHPSSMLNI